MPLTWKQTLLFSSALLSLSGFEVSADPGQSMSLYPVLALSGRAADPEHIVSQQDVVPVSVGSSDSISQPVVPGNEVAEFASADVPVESTAVGVASSSKFAKSSEPSAIPAPSGTAEGAFRDFQDTLIRTEQDSRVQTFVSEDGQRLPETWTVPPGSSVPGGHPGTRYTAPEVDYTGNSGVAYFPPPVVDSPYRGNSYSYPYTGVYHPGGPYAYSYDGMVPMGDPMWTRDARFEFEGDIPSFSRQFDPEQAHIKAGPFFFQALWVEAGVLYSDYHGPATFPPGEEPGWLSYASFGFQMTARLNPSLYFTAQGELIYLFGDNELGFRTGAGGGPFASLVYETEMGPWDIRAFAEFGTGSFYDMFGSDAYERAGMYSFGFLGAFDDGLLYDPYLYTRIGVEASTLVNPDWRLTLVADHTDYWYVGDEQPEDHWAREHLGMLYGAEPNRIPFTPWFSYDLYSDDYFDSTYNTVYVGGSGRLSQNVYFDGRVGYLFNTQDSINNNSWLWNVGLRHRISERTSHGVRFGQDFFMNDYSIDSTVSSFFQYYIEHQFTERLSMNAYAQWSTDDFLSGPYVGGEYQSEIYGIWVRYQLTDKLSTSLGYLEEQRHDTQNGFDYDRSLFEARLDAQIGQRSTGYLLYQHEDGDNYYEDLYMAGIRRYF